MASSSGMSAVEPESSNKIIISKTVTKPITDTTKQEGNLANEQEEEVVSWVDEGEEDDEARVELGLVGKIWTKRE